MNGTVPFEHDWIVPSYAKLENIFESKNDFSSQRWNVYNSSAVYVYSLLRLRDGMCQAYPLVSNMHLGERCEEHDL